MEKNVELVIIDSYHDIELDIEIECGKKRWVTEKRARELCRAGVARIKQIKRK